MEQEQPNSSLHPSSQMSVSYNVSKSTQSARISSMPAVTSIAKPLSVASASTPLGDERNSSSSHLDPSLRYIDAQRAVHSQYVMQLLQLQRRAGFLCDITIHVRERSFKAHKPLLAACSLYFRSLFADAAIKDSAALDLNILTPSGFEVLLDYIYSGSLAITAENSTEVLSAATCLQMTNVVETCLNFMRSSFRMCRTTDALQQVPTAAVLVNGTDPFGAAAKQWPAHSPQRTIAPPSKHSPHPPIKVTTVGGAMVPPDVRPLQDNLKIVSTGSINEAEFKSMLEHSNVPTIPPTPPTGLMNGDTAGGATESLPSTSQLQSVLPLLVTKEPRQPTLQEVQQLLSSLPQDSRPTQIQQPQHRSGNAWENSYEARQPQFAHHNLYHVPASKDPLALYRHPAVRTSSSDLAAQTGTSIFSSNVPPNSVQTDVIAATMAPGQQLSTVSAGAPLSDHAPEQYSGEPPPVEPLSQYATEEAVPMNTRESTDEASDQEDNHLEISDDEVASGEFVAWSADRSDEQQTMPTDLSGTPCNAITLNSSSPSSGGHLGGDHVTRGTVETPSQFESSIPAERMSKSLPASPSSAKSRNVRATSAVSDSTVWGTYGGLTEEVEPVLPNHNVTGLPPASSPAIVAKAIRTSLLPPRVSPTSSSQADVTLENGDLGPASIKVELLSDEDIDAVSGGFPVQDDVSKHADVTDDASTISNSLSRSPPDKSRRSYDSYNKDGNSDFEDLALDLSMPQRARALRSSEEEQEALVLTSDVKVGVAEEEEGALPLLRAPSEVSVQTGQDTGSESEMGYRGLDQQDLYGISNELNGGSQNSNDMSSAAFSRKPRRTTGGQTCTWPGCGRLFRHRNIYEEHQRLHELGIPVSQLRKCYMGARVKKTVREQLEEMRTSDSVTEGDGDAKQKNRKRKAVMYGQETVRKRVTVKDRMGSIYPPSAPQAPSIEPHMQPQHPLSQAQLRYLAQVSTGNRPPAQMSYPGVEMHSPRGFEAPKPAQQMMNPGLVRYVQGTDAQTHVNQSGVSVVQQLAHPPGSLNGQGPPQQAVAMYSSLSQHNQLVNPVEQTLALLGIPTPVRRGEGGPAITPATQLSELSIDQIRRRLALRETSVVSGAAQTMLFTSGTTATPTGSAAMVGSRPPASAARSGTVMGLHQAPPPRFFSQPPYISTMAPPPQLAANGAMASAPRPINYPGPTASSALGQGAKCS